ncbi:ABC transporter permease [Leucobacter sp. UT-8R-CII-1-4]|uniref:ABC transporter permease n=1 Tax=Leucobacter sp. UT-8R-CII-1-4 TaxID=3040075 RepID=UPI0024A8410A|nr:ABC transporter permease [Leucobacter sp. UT-8R-CII-1-4]MDI6022175.1 ABC transporter permease [Leucobacter sp. UT-8R-CII-1-4]
MPSPTTGAVGAAVARIRPRTSRPAGFLRRFMRHRLAVAGAITLLVIVAAVVIGPLLTPFPPETVDLTAKNQAPSLLHWMGTDELGRDQLSRILTGGRLTLSVAVAAVLSSLLLGVTVGAIAGYCGGVVDNILMRIVDVFYSLPALFVVILLVTLVGPHFWPIVISIALFSWMNTARLVRAACLAEKQQEFVTAARGLGARDLRLATVHVLPGAITPIVVTATLGIAAAILAESALSFLGMGFQPPESTWGALLHQSVKSVLTQGHWWRGFFPGLMIFLVALAVNYVGDGLSDALDPRRRRS